MQMHPSTTSAVIAPGASSGNTPHAAAKALKPAFSDGPGLASLAGSGSQRGIGVEITSGAAPRLAALSGAFAALFLAVGGAHATVTLSFGDSDFGSALTAGTGVSYWTDFSENCANVEGGSTCLLSATPAANPDSMLFSWGTASAPDSNLNSLLAATYTGAGATLTSITLASDQSGLGPADGPTTDYGGPYTPPTGTGSMVAYEQPNTGGTNLAIVQQNASEQRVNISIGGASVLSNQLVLGGRPDRWRAIRVHQPFTAH
jgi:hypothetical protein